MKKLLPIIAILSTGCLDTDGKDSGLSDGGLEVSVTWGASAVSLTISGGEAGANYQWGLAETGSTCNNGSGDCWTGEDCLDGYTTGSGTTYNYCHPVGGTTASLSYGADPSSVTAGQATVFGDSGFDGSVTYILDNITSGDCYIWGNDTMYYNGLGCNELQ